MSRDTLIFRLFTVVVLKGAIGLSEPQINSTVGDTVYLPCINIQGNIIIQWLRLNENTETVDSTYTTTYTDGWTVNTNLPQHERLGIVGLTGGEKYDLKISNLIKEDSGRYSCAVDNPNGTRYSYVTLKVEDLQMTISYLQNDTYFTTVAYKDTSQDLTFSSLTNKATVKTTASSSTNTATVTTTANTSVNHGPSYLQTYLIITSAGIVIVFIGVASFVLYQNQRRYIAAIQNHQHHRENDRRPTANSSLVGGLEQNESNHETIPKAQYADKLEHSDVLRRSQIDINSSIIVNTEVKSIKSSYQPEHVQNAGDLPLLDNQSSSMNTGIRNQYEQLTDNWSNCSPVYQQRVESSDQIELQNKKGRYYSAYLR
ncbi:LRRC4C [Mytilus coruscus]|uniref:LRRC4C n=1 Tax=Mytilus coruscus TaxID=42192 RepID=A0A6J8BFE4_MYTCO|nr:LRRC4C [Mytilus coruscus]